MSQECGCRVRYDMQEPDPSVTLEQRQFIVYCPLHRAGGKLVEAAKEQDRALDWLFAVLIAKDKNSFPSKSPAWRAIVMGSEAIAETERKE